MKIKVMCHEEGFDQQFLSSADSRGKPLKDCLISTVTTVLVLAQVPAGVKEFKLIALDSASICILVHGEGLATNDTIESPLKLRKGAIFFMAAQQEASVSVTSDGMLLFRAYAGLL